MRSRPIYPGPYKPQLIMGCEKLPWAILALFSAITVILAPTIIYKIIGFIFGGGLMLATSMINKKEPYRFEMLMRYMQFQKFYLNVAKYPSRPIRVKNFK